MFVSILRRKTRVTDRARLESQLSAALPKIKAVLESSPGFVSVQYVFDVFEVGALAQMTTWSTEDDCRRYVREGAAATVGTLEEAALPTALHPDGAWVRHTYEIGLGG